MAKPALTSVGMANLADAFVALFGGMRVAFSIMGRRFGDVGEGEVVFDEAIMDGQGLSPLRWNQSLRRCPTLTLRSRVPLHPWKEKLRNGLTI